MERKKRLGKGLEDISHFFLSSIKPAESKPAQTEKRYETATHANPPKAMAVISRTPGIPTIFWTSYLALVLARHGKKVLVIDVGTKNEELSNVFKPLTIHPSLGDLLNQPEKAIAVESPFSFRVLAFQMQLGELCQFKEGEREILFQILRREEQQADVLFLNTSLDWKEKDDLSYLKCLHRAILIASPLDLLGAYRILKVLFHIRPSLPVGLVGQAGPNEGSQDGVERLVMACNRFLKRSPMVLGKIPVAELPSLLWDQKEPLSQAWLEIAKKTLQGLNSRASLNLFFDEIRLQLNTVAEGFMKEGEST